MVVVRDEERSFRLRGASQRIQQTVIGCHVRLNLRNATLCVCHKHRSLLDAPEVKVEVCLRGYRGFWDERKRKTSGTSSFGVAAVVGELQTFPVDNFFHSKLMYVSYKVIEVFQQSFGRYGKRVY